MLLRLLFVLFVLSEVTTSQMKYFFLCLWMFISHIFSSVTEDLYDQNSRLRTCYSHKIPFAFRERENHEHEK